MGARCSVRMLLALAACAMPSALTAVQPGCDCSAPALCKASLQPDRKEVFGFSVRQAPSMYRQWDWEQLTTVAWNTDPELVCLAHEHGARVVANAELPANRSLLESAAYRAEWVQARLDEAGAHHTDGINFDLEDAAAPGSPLARAYTALVAETAAAFRKRSPAAQISVDVAWSPFGVDGRNYDVLGLAAAADLLFVMAYDTQSQIWGRCVASANSPLALARRGVQQYLDLGVPAGKLVLGLPWYGYAYPCQAARGGLADASVCVLKPTDFRGAPCSDAAGAQKEYSELMRWLASNATGGALWDDTQASPYFNYEDEHGGIFQVWYDDPRSLRAKYALAAELGLRGVGVWNLDLLEYGEAADPAAAQQTRDMWAALRAFTGAPGAAPAPAPAPRAAAPAPL